MTDDLHNVVEECRALMVDARRLVSAVAGGRQRAAAAPWQRVELRPVHLNAGERLQITTFDDRQSHITNAEWGEPAEHEIAVLLAEPFRYWHIKTTDGELAFQVTKAGKVLVQRSHQQHQRRTDHDRVKARLVDPSEPYLKALGVTGASGNIIAARKRKYHQVEEFVRLLDSSVRDAMTAGRLDRRPLRIVDLGCGNAYLSFAAYRHLTDRLGVPVKLIGVDVKAQAREHNSAVATELGWSRDVTFVAATISEYQPTSPVDVVLALHACDTATDDALARAVEWNASLILAAPCCSNDIQRQLRRDTAPDPYGLIVRHGMLRERFGDVLTDALRAALLRRSGYRTDVVEFVDTTHTPRNLLIRGHLTSEPVVAASGDDYEDLVAQWQVQPRLASLLDRVPRVASGE